MIRTSLAANGNPDDAAARQSLLVQALRSPECYPHPVREIEILETHISYVLLTGAFAYKIKKPVDLGFLDFSSLEKRRFYCDEELRLNRRLAPDLYREVVPIAGPLSHPRLGGTSPPVEYAVKMVQFPQAALLDRILSQGGLSPEHIDALADRVAVFHRQAARAAADGEYGKPAAVWAPMAQNFSQLSDYLQTETERRLLDELEGWSCGQYAGLEGIFLGRQRAGFVRECHGDLHLGNVALMEGVPQIFDCIEFNPNLRWIDVMSEIAFTVMDLEARNRPDFARRFLNRYLEASGDYPGLRVLPLYRVYRALVRAKVACIRAAQEDSLHRQRNLATAVEYLALARWAASPPRRELLLMHGVSGSGKTWLAQALAARNGAICLRSDIERKRLHGLTALTRSASTLDSGLYDSASTLATYRRLADLAGVVLAAGFPVVVDAASLKTWQRDLFRILAREMDVPFRLVACHASAASLRRRICRRQQAGSDASDADAAVLEHQIQSLDPLSAAEIAASVSADTDRDRVEDICKRLETGSEA